MADPNIQTLDYQVEEVGKHLKGSKKRLTWLFSLKDNKHQLVLDSSILSGKIKLSLDKKILVENQMPPGVAFQYPFALDGFSLNVIQQGDNFEFRINNKVFSHLYNQQKTKASFKRQEDTVVDDFKIDNNIFQPQGKTMKLKIGGIDMKKKQINQSDNWKSMNGNQGFSSFFNQNQSNLNSEIKILKPPQNNLYPSLIEVDTKEKVQQIKQITKISQINNLNLLQDNSNLNTMQYMFNTSNIPKKQSTISFNPNNQYNTMQKMFSTMNLQGTQQNQYKNKIQLNITNNNINDYNTMQNLFGTQNNTNIPQISKINQNNNNLDINNNFNDIFTTNSGKIQNKDKNYGEISAFRGVPQQQKQNQINFNDFNTMQNMFKTQISNNISNFNQKNQFHISHQINNQQKQVQLDFMQSQQPQINDFNTMQRMFASNVANLMIIKPQNTNESNLKNTDANDFSTMQFLFNTNCNTLKSQVQQNNETQGQQNNISLL